MTMSKGGYILRKEDRTAKDQQRTIPSTEIGMRQLFDEKSSTYTYLLWDKETEDAIIVDPVDTQVGLLLW